MRKAIFIFIISVLLLHAKCVAQNNTVYGAGISYTNGVPTFVPPSRSARVAIDTVTGKWYEFATPGGWRFAGDRIQRVSGCSAPSYTPTKAQSWIVINGCTEAQNGQGPELYAYDGTAWIFINEKSTAPTYTAGTGISISGDTITNTGDLSNTNELQTLSSGTNTVTLSNGGGTVTVDTDPTNDITTITAGTGIGVSGTGNSRTVTNTSPDQVVTISGATGSYPNFTIPSPAVTLNDLTDVTLSSPANNQILQYNTATTQWVNATLAAITGSGAAGMVAVWNSSNTIAGYENFEWDNALKVLKLNKLPGLTSKYLIIGDNSSLVSTEINAELSSNQKAAINVTCQSQSASFFATPSSVKFGSESAGAAVIFGSLRASAGGATYINFSTNGAATGCRWTHNNGPDLALLTSAGRMVLGNNSLSTGAAFQINSTTAIMVPPNMTSTQRDAIATPPNGIIFNTTTGKFQGYAAGTWVDFH